MVCEQWFCLILKWLITPCLLSRELEGPSEAREVSFISSFLQYACIGVDSRVKPVPPVMINLTQKTSYLPLTNILFRVEHNFGVF